MKCSVCGREYAGDACPHCAKAAARPRRKGGFFRIFWRILITLFLIALVLTVAFIVLDWTNLGNNPADPALYGYTSFVRGVYAGPALEGYEWFKVHTTKLVYDIIDQSGVIF